MIVPFGGWRSRNGFCTFDPIVRTSSCSGHARMQRAVARSGRRYNPLQSGRPTWATTTSVTAKPTPLKILVIDDDPRLRDLLSRYLEEQGFQVATLADARELDRRLQRAPPHLIVLDLMLPYEDGLAVCRRLRAAGEVVPI